MKHAKLISATLLGSALAMTGCATVESQMQTGNPIDQPQLKSKIESVGKDKVEVGQMFLRSVDSGVQVYGKISGLTPNKVYALHIHELGSCDQMGKLAGGHFNPNLTDHGDPNNPNSHAGDLPNIQADKDGVASINYVNTKISTTPNVDNSVFNRSFVLHAGADDYTTQPSGGSGDRIACGVIVAD